MQPFTTAILACVAWRFWLGALYNKGGRGQRNREEVSFAARGLRRYAGYSNPGVSLLSFFSRSAKPAGGSKQLHNKLCMSF